MVLRVFRIEVSGKIWLTDSRPMKIFAALLVSSISLAEALTVGINVDPSNTQYGFPTATQVQDLNASMVRIEYHDSTAGPAPDPKKLSFYAAAVTRYRAVGIDTLMIIDYSSYGVGKPAGNAAASVWEAYIAGFNVRSVAVAKHFAGQLGIVSHFELWNEEDLHGSAAYDPYVPPEMYAQMLGNFSAGLKGLVCPVVVVFPFAPL
jgi:hypothetical protein